MWRDLPFVVALVAVCASIASFIALLEPGSRGWGVIAIEHVSLVLLPLSIALALAVERRATVGAWQALVAVAAVSVAFAVVALVKMYTYSPSPTFATSFAGLDWANEAAIVATGAVAFGLLDRRAHTTAAGVGFVAALCAAVGCAAYAIVLQPSSNEAFTWYLLSGAAAALAGSAAARMQRL